MSTIPQHAGYPIVFSAPPGEKGSGVYVGYLDTHKPDGEYTVYEMAKEEVRQFAEGMRLTYLFLHGGQNILDDEP